MLNSSRILSDITPSRAQLIMPLAVFLGCHTPAAENACEPSDLCHRDTCDGSPLAIQHPDWHDRLTQSPTIQWEPAEAGMRYEIALGTAPGETDVECWVDAGEGTSFQFQSIWFLEEGQTYYPVIRGVNADGSYTKSVSSEGWTVDITPPSAPVEVSDFYVPALGELHWDDSGSDDASGFSHYEFAVGTIPGFDDLSPWTNTEAPDRQQLSKTSFNSLDYVYVSIRSVDVAGNTSMPTSGGGYIDCPNNYIYIPPSEIEPPNNQSIAPLLEARPVHDFCISKYEMRAQGVPDGTGLVYSTELVAESRADGLPWTRLVEGDENGNGSGDASISAADLACRQLGEGFALIGNWEWQSIARSIESTPENWSTHPETGLAYINRGHSDRWPLRALEAADDDQACIGTENPFCSDPLSADFSQKRTHLLPNGGVIWDFAGNVSEWVSGSHGFDGNLWTAFSDPAFTTEAGWEDRRQRFGPLGDYDHENGMGLIYNGFGNLARGCNYDPSPKGQAGSEDILNVGIYSGGHNNWQSDEKNGFRCIYFIP